MQQVDLYLPEFRPQRHWFSLTNHLIVVGLTVLLFTGTYVYQRLHLTNLDAQVNTLEARSEELAAQVSELKQKPDVSNQKQALEQELARTRAVIRNRESILVVMESESLGNQTGFSRHLAALSRQLPKAMALQHFAFYRGGLSVFLAGESQVPEQVPLYLSRLQEEPVFAVSDFGDMRLHRSGGALRFALNQPQPDSMGPSIDPLRKGTAP